MFFDGAGAELASNDDALGLGGDSQLSYTFPAAGEYLLELRDIRFQGGPYRLRIGDFPCAAVAYPLAVQRGTATPVAVAGPFIGASAFVTGYIGFSGDPDAPLAGCFGATGSRNYFSWP